MSIYVAADERGRGIGTALLHAVLKTARASSLEDVYSFVAKDNAASLRMCHRCGFVQIGTLHLPRSAQADQPPCFSCGPCRFRELNDALVLHELVREAVVRRPEP